MLTSSAAISAQNNFQGLISGYIYRYTSRRYGPGSTETTKRRITQKTPYDSSGKSSFLMPKISAKLKRGHPEQRHQM